MQKRIAILMLMVAVTAMALAQESSDTLALLRTRKDKKALVIFEQVLSKDPQNLGALWGKAEVLRRRRDYKQAEALLQKVLERDPYYASALLSLSYIRLKEDNFKEALSLVNRAMQASRDNKSNQALAYVMLGTIKGRRASAGGILAKLRYGIGIKGSFLKAKRLAPEIPEVYLALGTFYILAPQIMGASPDRAIQELEFAVKIAPEFATANARLACAYKSKGNLEKYHYYLKRTIELDPQNEVLKEIVDVE